MKCLVDLILLRKFVRKPIYEIFKTKDGKEHYKVKVVKRNDSRLNNNQRLQLQGWRANCDIQVITDYHSCLEYIAKYASKGEKMSSVAKDAFTSVLANCQNVDSGKKNQKKSNDECCWTKGYEHSRSNASDSFN